MSSAIRDLPVLLPLLGISENDLAEFSETSIENLLQLKGILDPAEFVRVKKAWREQRQRSGAQPPPTADSAIQRLEERLTRQEQTEAELKEQQLNFQHQQTQLQLKHQEQIELQLKHQQEQQQEQLNFQHQQTQLQFEQQLKFQTELLARLTLLEQKQGLRVSPFRKSRARRKTPASRVLLEPIME